MLCTQLFFGQINMFKALFCSNSILQHSRISPLLWQSYIQSAIRTQIRLSKFIYFFEFESLQQNGEDINCIFTEAFSEKTGRTIFTSLIHKAWHIAIKNNGIVRAGERINKTGSHNYTNEFTPLTIKKKDDDEE